MADELQFGDQFESAPHLMPLAAGERREIKAGGIGQPVKSDERPALFERLPDGDRLCHGEDVRVRPPPVINVTLNVFVPEASAAFEGMVALASVEVIPTVSPIVLTVFQFVSTAMDDFRVLANMFTLAPFAAKSTRSESQRK